MPIALLTDFGTRDYFVGAMKGAILSVDPAAVIIDITHHIAPHDIDEAASTLRACYRDFPVGTIFVAVVDPGVGSKRRAILAEAEGYYFLAPDNGILSFISGDAAFRVFEITNREFIAGTVSNTFHGRDIFAPAAAHLSRGADPAEFGPLVRDFVRFSISTAMLLPTGDIEGEIIMIDRFGNLVTNLAKDVLPAEFTLEINGRTIDTHLQFYAEAEPGEVFSIWGSAGFLEISVRDGSAKERLGARRGDKIRTNGNR